MPSLTGQISFTVKFDLTGSPTLKLLATTSIPLIDKPNLTGYFSIKQPDGITVTGSYTSPDVAWNVGAAAYPEFSSALRLASDQLYQRGEYIITLYANCAGYTPGVFSRSFNINYQPVTVDLENQFDCFTPSLKYEDLTNYAVSNYNIASSTRSWSATSAAGNPTGVSNIFDLAIGGSYYDCSYAITFIKNITYQHSNDAWLTVAERFTENITEAAFIPASMNTNLTYLVALKATRDAAANCQGNYEVLDELYEDASTLFHQMRAQVCAENTTNLTALFDEFYRLTHNYQPQVYVNTNGAIAAYDFTAGCSGGGSGTAAVKIEVYCKVDSTPIVQGTTDAVTGLTASSNVISCAAFAGKRVRIIRGSIPIFGGDPAVGSFDPGNGGYYFTKVLASTDITLLQSGVAAPLISDELIYIETLD